MIHYKFFALIAGMVLMTAVSCSGGFKPTAVRGVLDCSELIWATSGPIDLSGEWEFYPNALIPPSAFQGPITPSAGRTYVTVPSLWRISAHSPVRRLFDITEGCATYTLIIKNIPPTTDKHFALATRDMASSYTVYAIPLDTAGFPISPNESDSPVIFNGRPSCSLDAAIPQFLPAMEYIPKRSSSYLIVMHIANFHHARGGFWNKLYLGPEKAMRLIHLRLFSIDALLIGIMLIMSFYHFGLFIVRRQDVTYLLFSLTCLTIALRLTLTAGFIALLCPPTPSFSN